MEGHRIRHTVIFRLVYDLGSPEETQFMRDGERILSCIPTVERFEALRQVSPKNDFTFGFSMEFADQSAYEAYNAHPEHVAFVEKRWKKEVTDFLEIDYRAWA